MQALASLAREGGGVTQRRHELKSKQKVAIFRQKRLSALEILNYGKIKLPKIFPKGKFFSISIFAFLERKFSYKKKIFSQFSDSLKFSEK